MKTWSELTEQERADLQQRRLNGEFDRYRLIRFGYLSLSERRRLRELYPDLDERFEPETDKVPGERAFKIFIVYVIGLMLGAISASGSEAIGLISVVMAIFLYWVAAILVHRFTERVQGDRNELYWEWRGYRCDRHGREI
jgi:hypothetical protein